MSQASTIRWKIIGRKDHFLPIRSRENTSPAPASLSRALVTHLQSGIDTLPPSERHPVVADVTASLIFGMHCAPDILVTQRWSLDQQRGLLEMETLGPRPDGRSRAYVLTRSSDGSHVH